jgi:hypothetical protein
MVEKMKLSYAIEQLQRVVAEVERRQENNEPLDDLDIDFESSNLSLKDAVDRRGWLLKSLSSQIDAATATADFWRRKIDYLKRTKEIIEKQTVELVERNPEWDWQGNACKLRVASNGGKLPVKWQFDDVLTTMKRVVDAHVFPAEYIEMRQVAVLKPEFEEAVREGKLTTDVAYVAQRGKHLRVS